ncbi:hypothetical protein [Rhodococcus sp. IEGM 1408]|uniref:hypothetical protein n=1 Tax=Rhodococcus sp. IEGM 1408 TaxID=3082220 RepID=UPI0029540533|nr:hypothetical protein [Rhodococcus sp. IEGM 1408]
MRPHYGSCHRPAGTPPRQRPGAHPGHRRRVRWHGAPRRCLLEGMQGILVVLVPVLLAGFALLMERFEAAILARPEQIET